jgi:hypothetical protein
MKIGIGCQIALRQPVVHFHKLLFAFGRFSSKRPVDPQEGIGL